MKTNLLIATFLLALLLGFQNCSKVGFAPAQNTENITCVEGKKLGIWLANGTFLGDIVTYSGSISAEANYNYYSASAHPINGPAPIGYELHNFFYEGTDGLVLNFYGNIDSDNNSDGSPDNEYSIKLTTKGNGQMDNVVFVDDPGQDPGGDYLRRTKYADRNEYIGSYHYWYNTDGSIVGPFMNENFEIHVEIVSAGDLQGARFYSANGTSFNLGQTDQMSYVIKYREYEDCN